MSQVNVQDVDVIRVRTFSSPLKVERSQLPARNEVYVETDGSMYFDLAHAIEVDDEDGTDVTVLLLDQSTIQANTSQGSMRLIIGDAVFFDPEFFNEIAFNQLEPTTSATEETQA